MEVHPLSPARRIILSIGLSAIGLPFPARAYRTADDAVSMIAPDDGGVFLQGVTGRLGDGPATGPYGKAATTTIDDGMEAIQAGVLRNLADPALGRAKAAQPAPTSSPLSFGPYGKAAPQTVDDGIKMIRSQLATNWRTNEAIDVAQGLAPSQDLTTAGVVSSRGSPMYDPWVRGVRELREDYRASKWPDGPPVDASGRLTRDIEGRPLNPSATIAGRRLAEGADASLTPEELNTVATRAFGAEPMGVAPRSVPGAGVGAYRREQTAEGLERAIFFDRTLAQATRDKVVAHEFGHGVDDITGDFIGSTGPQPFAIPQKGISKELNDIYNELNNADFRAALDRTGDIPSALARAAKNRGLKPQHQGYSDKEASAELIAEAVRFYAADPNAMKTLAPKTAALIRARVNGNPTLSPHIQFNSMAGLAAAGGGAATLYGFAPPAEAGDANERGSLPPFNLGPLLRKGF